MGWLYVCSSLLPRPHPLPPPQWLLLITSKPFELNLRYLVQREYRSGKVYWMTFSVTQGNGCGIDKQNLLVCRMKWEPLSQSLQILQLCPSGHAFYLIRFCRNSVGIFFFFFFPNCLWKFLMCFFKVEYSIGDISGMVVPVDMKRKGGA